MRLQKKSNNYEEFVEKFKPKLTTDDCYTPHKVYEAIKDWAVSEYKLEEYNIIRPFKPNGDYKAEQYDENTVVIDNPPFYILSSICQWYDERGIKYFLFAPTLTHFSTNSGKSNYVVSGSTIVYENGAKVRTAFVTNMGEWKIRVAPDLSDEIKKAQIDPNKEVLPKYKYPQNVITSTALERYVRSNTELKIKADEVKFLRVLDSQKAHKKSIFGAGFLYGGRLELLKDKVAEDGAIEWQLSQRERDIINNLSK